MWYKKLEVSYKKLVEELSLDSRVNEIERCVILYQMGTFVGNDIFDEISKYTNFSLNSVLTTNPNNLVFPKSFFSSEQV